MLPAVQDVQDPAPEEEEKEPAGQSVHDVDPAAEYLPAEHVPEQAEVVEPDEVPNVPAGQSEQDGSPANEYLPALHVVQALIAMLPETDVVPAEQEAQTFWSVKVLD